ncbi:MAG: undecaprenyl-phosphate glucose phosphotransferase, partial [Lachnospiraceae bacterium]|nr:undecaprenyl-phosphate glucose phosphotransferase [Lachnospiraceae bacterium]
MIEANEKYYNRFLAVIDAVILTISYWLAWYVRFRSGLFSSSVEAVPYVVYMRALFVMVPAMLILYSACN